MWFKLCAREAGALGGGPGRGLQQPGVQRAHVGLHAEGGHRADAAERLAGGLVGAREVLVRLQQCSRAMSAHTACSVSCGA